MKYLLQALKYLGGILLLIFVVALGIFGYQYYEELEKKQAELSFSTKSPWQWHDKYGRVQIKYNEALRRSFLREVNLEKSYAVYAFKGDNYELNAIAVFQVKCEPKSEITTSQKFDDGTPKILRCSDDGDSLSINVSWEGRNTNVIWEENLDGFGIKQNFSYWDFSKLDQEITLAKAKNANKSVNSQP